MIIGEHLRAIREQKGFSQGEIEKRTGLLRCYISRVENGHTVPAIETLEKIARALEVPLYQLFYEGTDAPSAPKLPTDVPELSKKDARYWEQLRSLFSRTNPRDLQLLLAVARQMAKVNGQLEREKPKSALRERKEPVERSEAH